MSAAIYPATAQHQATATWRATLAQPAPPHRRAPHPVTLIPNPGKLPEPTGAEARRRALIALAQAGDRSARNQLIESNMRLAQRWARWYAQRYQLRVLEFDDLAQEGALGLMRAIDKFDLASPWRFATYASWWIRSLIHNAIETREPAIRITDTHRRRLSQHLIAAAISLDASPASGRGLVDTSAQAHFDDVEWSEAGERITQTLLDMLAGQRISAREIVVLSRRFAHGQTLEEIGSYLGLTRERVRQLEVSAKAKLGAELARLGMRSLADLGAGGR